MVVGGIDGCPAGWALIKHDGNIYSFYIYPTLAELIQTHHDLERVLIDIPLGLSSMNTLRTIDSLMRKELPGRASTVFNAPSRPAVYSGSYGQAKHENLVVEGKKVSKQSWYISGKIRELDELYQTVKTDLEIVESHPELCLRYLNGGKVVMSKKKTREGQDQRLDLISDWGCRAREIYDAFCSQTLRKNVRKDDIIDALILCVVNRLAGPDKLSFLKDYNLKDSRNIEIRIAFVKTSDL